MDKVRLKRKITAGKLSGLSGSNQWFDETQLGLRRKIGL